MIADVGLAALYNFLLCCEILANMDVFEFAIIATCTKIIVIVVRIVCLPLLTVLPWLNAAALSHSSILFSFRQKPRRGL